MELDAVVELRPSLLIPMNTVDPLVLDQLNSSSGSLELDSESLEPSQLSLAGLMRELALKNKPSWLLVKLMGLLEEKRSAQGLGWSRPWNKAGMTVFRSFRLSREVDHETVGAALCFLSRFVPRLSSGSQDFIHSLLEDLDLMVFMFVHNREVGTRQYEGVTFSLGRRIPGDPSKRDRVDIIVEDQRHQGRVDGSVDLVRVLVCPWTRYGATRDAEAVESASFSPEDWLSSHDFYRTLVSAYHANKVDPGKQWNHWSSSYISYFGARRFIPVGSSFT